MKKVKWILENGETRFAMCKGKPELWNENELHILHSAIKISGYPAFSKDYKVFIANPEGLPDSEIIRVVNYEIV